MSLNGFTAAPKDNQNDKSYLSGFSVPTPQSLNEYGLNQEAEKAQAESDKANSFGTLLKETITGIPKQAEKSSENVLSAANDAVKNTWDTYKQFPNKLMADINAGADDINKGNAARGLAKAGFRAAGDFAIAVFAPISSAIGAAIQTIGGQKLMDKSGQVIADASGITDLKAFQKFAMTHPNFAEDFNRMLMLVMSGGEKGKQDPGKIASEIHNLAEKTIKQAEPIEAKPEPAKILSPEEKQAAYAKSQGYEPYTPADKLPVIDAGKPAKSSLPSIQIGESIRVTKNSTGDLVYEPIKEPGYKPTPEPTPEPAPIERPVLPDGTRVTKAASDINNNLVKKGIESLPLSEQSKYETGSYKEESGNIATLLTNDPAKAVGMATGEIPLDGVKYPEILFNAVEAKAMEEGDVATLQKLANSPVSKTSEAGATLGSHAFNDNPNSVVDTMKSIKRAKEADFEKSTGKKAADVKNADIKSAKAEIQKAAPGKGAWQEFINQIKCNY